MHASPLFCSLTNGQLALHAVPSSTCKTTCLAASHYDRLKCADSYGHCIASGW